MLNISTIDRNAEMNLAPIGRTRAYTRNVLFGICVRRFEPIARPTEKSSYELSKQCSGPLF